MTTFRHYHRKWRIWNNRNNVRKIFKKLTPLMLAVLLSKNVDGQGLPLFENIIWEGQNDGNLQYPFNFSYPYGLGISCQFLDIDNDGDKDIISFGYDYYSQPNYYNQLAFKWRFLENDGIDFFHFSYPGSDSFQFHLNKSNLDKIYRENRFSIVDSYLNIDIDGDADLDIVNLNQNYFEIQTFLNNPSDGSNVFDTIPIITQLDEKFAGLTGKFAYINDDDNLDIFIMLAEDDYNISYVLNTGTSLSPSFDYNSRIRCFNRGDFNKVSVSDINQDGWMDILDFDLLYSDYNLINVQYYKCLSIDPLVFSSTPKQIFVETVNAPYFNSFYGFEMEFVDFDNDGDLDILGYEYGDFIYGGARRSNTFIWENTKIVPINNITGKINIDLNGDGYFSRDENFFYYYNYYSGETHLKHKIENHPIFIENNNQLSTIDNKGKFKIYTKEGTTKLYPKPIPNFEFTPPFYEFNFPADTNISIDSVDFVMTPITGRHDVNIDIAGLATRPGFASTHYITFKNLAGMEESGTIAYTPDVNLQVTGSEPPYDRMASGTYYWDFDSLTALESKQINVALLVDVNATLNDTIQSNVSIELASGTDFNPWDNQDSIVQRITGSYDPNDKIVTPEGNIDGLMSITENPFEYTIRFQNTGTDTAFTVIITDTLDTDFQLSSFEMIGASHPYEFSVRDNKVLVWKFYDIFLPDSSVNFRGSQGFVKYRLIPSDGADIGTAFTNKASIYFDYNQPIVTNETKNIFAVISGINEHEHQTEIKSKAYPNPAREKIMIEVNNPTKQALIFTIYDVNGKQVYSKMVEDNFFHTDISDYSGGMYLYTIEGVDVFGKGKFVKE